MTGVHITAANALAWAAAVIAFFPGWPRVIGCFSLILIVVVWLWTLWSVQDQ